MDIGGTIGTADVRCSTLIVLSDSTIGKGMSVTANLAVALSPDEEATALTASVRYSAATISGATAV